jgi:hypothetical protein
MYTASSESLRPGRPHITARAPAISFPSMTVSPVIWKRAGPTSRRRPEAGHRPPLARGRSRHPARGSATRGDDRASDHCGYLPRGQACLCAVDGRQISSTSGRPPANGYSPAVLERSFNCHCVFGLATGKGVMRRATARRPGGWLVRGHGRLPMKSAPASTGVKRPLQK